MKTARSIFVFFLASLFFSSIAFAGPVLSGKSYPKNPVFTSFAVTTATMTSTTTYSLAVTDTFIQQPTTDSTTAFQLIDKDGNVDFNWNSTAGEMIITGGQFRSTTSITAATYDLLVSDYFLNCDYTATAAITSLTLPTAQMVAGRIIHIVDTGGSANTNNITIDTEGAEKISGADTQIISSAYGAVSLMSNGTHWFIF
jgi:hypothetical protein